MRERENRKKTHRKRILQDALAMLLAVAMLLPFSAAAPGQGAWAQAAGRQSGALKAYKKFLRKSQVDVKVSNSAKLKMDNASFLVTDVDHDGIPELVLETSQQFGMACDSILFTYHKGKVEQVLNTDHGGLIVYEQGNVFMRVHMNPGYSRQEIMTLSQGRAKVLAAYQDDSAAVGDQKATIKYTIGKKNVSRKRYQAYLQKLTNNSKRTDLQSGYHKVTSANIKKYVR